MTDSVRVSRADWARADWARADWAVGTLFVLVVPVYPVSLSLDQGVDLIIRSLHLRVE